MVYFVDPKFAEDFETKGKGEVTLSYTFFPSVDAERGEKRAEATPTKHSSALGVPAKAGYSVTRNIMRAVERGARACRI